MQQSTLERTAIAFRLERRFEGPRERVFRAWTDPEALKHWWCPEGWLPAEIEVDLRVGGFFRIGMRRQNGGTPVYASGVFLEVSPPGRLAYTWKWENAFEQMPETRVTVEFRLDGDATMMSLTHKHFPEIGLCLQHRSGWMSAWDRIERIM